MPAGPNGARRVTRRTRFTINRSSCRTCKIRHIRCDSASPACRNCTSTGRTCDGVIDEDKFVFVGSAPKRRQLHLNRHDDRIVPSRALSPLRRPEELQSYQVFFVRAAPLFSTGALDARLWRETVPRLSHSMDFAWNAAISIGLLFDNPILASARQPNSKGPLSLQPQQMRALQWYSRSVSSLTQRMSNVQSDEMLALLSCIVFTVCEFQQGNAASGFALVERGINILAKYLSPVCLALPVSPSTASLEQAVVPFFTRQALTFWRMGLPRLYQFTSMGKFTKTFLMQPRFTSVERASGTTLQGLFDLFHHAYEISSPAILVLDQPEELQAIVRLQAYCLGQLHAWRQRLTVLLETTATPEVTNLILYLRLYHTVLAVIVATCLSPKEKALDNHIADFQSIVEIASTLSSSTVDPPPPLDAGIKPPLYFAASRCRDPQLRRKALELFCTAPTPKPWRVPTAIEAVLPFTAIMERIIAFEETPTSFVGDNPTELRAGEIPEERRVHHVQIITQERSLHRGGGRELALRFITYTSTRQMVEHVIDLAN